ncbi:MAG TPA: acyl-CoA thioesterase [Bacteroidia bacterium]|jgi:acyl-CoA thioester hydrolase|nr:acyl-CoA thioesterase [Bacteroidia bacterium]
MKNFEKVIESKTKIRFSDCDPFNHLNNSKYIDYFMNAREDQLFSYYDFDLYKLAAEKDISWVVVQNQIAYLQPALLMETVVIQTQLLSYGNKNISFEAVMWNQDKTIIKSILWSGLIHYNLKTQRSEIHTEELMDLFKKIENPLEQVTTFEARVISLKENNKR